MKKILTSMTALIGMTIAFTACNESKDDHPILNPVPAGTEVAILNIPEMTNSSIAFTQENASGYVHMTCSQPENYEFAAPVSYQVEVSFDKDFTTPVVADAPASVTLMTAFSDCSEINPVNSELAAAVCDLSKVIDETDLPTQPRKLYIRLVANVKSAGSFPNNDSGFAPNTTILSNVVSIESVRCDYLAISVPDLPTGIYLRGGMNDWGSPDDYQFLTTKTFGVSVIASCSISAGTEFKVADSSWGAINLGAGGTLAIGTAYKLESGGGNITMPEDFNGTVTLTQKGDSYTVLFSPIGAAE